MAKKARSGLRLMHDGHQRTITGNTSWRPARVVTALQARAKSGEPIVQCRFSSLVAHVSLLFSSVFHRCPSVAKVWILEPEPRIHTDLHGYVPRVCVGPPGLW